MAQNRPDSCSPETLEKLQTVFDAIWHRLEKQRSPLTFPWVVEASRYTIATLVLEYLNDSEDIDRIQQDIMQRLRSR